MNWNNIKSSQYDPYSWVKTLLLSIIILNSYESWNLKSNSNKVPGYAKEKKQIIICEGLYFPFILLHYLIYYFIPILAMPGDIYLRILTLTILPLIVANVFVGKLHSFYEPVKRKLLMCFCRAINNSEEWVTNWVVTCMDEVFSLLCRGVRWIKSIMCILWKIFWR